MTTKKAMLALLLVIFLAASASGQEQAGMKLTLEDSILMALKNNLNLAVEVYNPELADATLSRAREFFLPSLDFSYDRERQRKPLLLVPPGLGHEHPQDDDYRRIRRPDRSPGAATCPLSLQNYKSETNQAFQLINPRYGSTLRFDFTQPLLKNFGPKVARRQIIVARNNLDIAQSQLRTTIIATVYQVQEAYWTLVYAIENLNVKRQSLQLARDLLAKNKKEVDVRDPRPARGPERRGRPSPSARRTSSRPRP